MKSLTGLGFLLVDHIRCQLQAVKIHGKIEMNTIKNWNYWLLDNRKVICSPRSAFSKLDIMHFSTKKKHLNSLSKFRNRHQFTCATRASSYSGLYASCVGASYVGFALLMYVSRCGAINLVDVDCVWVVTVLGRYVVCIYFGCVGFRLLLLLLLLYCVGYSASSPNYSQIGKKRE